MTKENLEIALSKILEVGVAGDVHVIADDDLPIHCLVASQVVTFGQCHSTRDLRMSCVQGAFAISCDFDEGSDASAGGRRRVPSRGRAEGRRGALRGSDLPNLRPAFANVLIHPPVIDLHILYMYI
ncbi:unnamed protein product [Pieris macdunnoughi]|uniref:Uncharacterized protein n=1 Tax=Pieris macdunnoughi TaxID=345717 RepID=A0A821RSD0_9NEOP|nr:unnamed protein product [Pieris macdunnoughi]